MHTRRHICTQSVQAKAQDKTQVKNKGNQAGVLELCTVIVREERSVFHSHGASDRPEIAHCRKHVSSKGSRKAIMREDGVAPMTASSSRCTRRQARGSSLSSGTHANSGCSRTHVSSSLVCEKQHKICLVIR
eukprot:6199468-Pleurochrysis_carterae.AAC.1